MHRHFNCTKSYQELKSVIYEMFALIYLGHQISGASCTSPKRTSAGCPTRCAVGRKWTDLGRLHWPQVLEWPRPSRRSSSCWWFLERTCPWGLACSQRWGQLGAASAPEWAFSVRTRPKKPVKKCNRLLVQNERMTWPPVAIWGEVH